MANTILHKRSSTPSGIPLVGDLTLGELAVNTYDGKLFLKKNDGADAIITLGDVIEDLTPQLGAALDVNGNAIVSVSAGDIAITPDTTGSIILDGLSWPQADGASGTVLQTDAAGNLTFVEIAIVLDLTPQLGANLDVNGNSIVSVTNGDIAITPDGTGKTVVTALEAPMPLQTQIGLTYDPVLADADKMITMDNGAANTVTIPANGSVAYPVGSKLNFMQLGAGKTTIAITTDTLDSLGAVFSLSQYGKATALKITATSWVLYGDIVA